MAEETTYVKKSAAERQAEILVSALERAQQNDGVLLNAQQKAMPQLYEKRARVSPTNALMMAMHSDQNNAKTNIYTQFSEAKKRGESVRGGEKGVPFVWTSNNEYVNKSNPEDKLSRKEYQLLDDSAKPDYKPNPKEELLVLFNVDQTTMHHVNKESHDQLVVDFGPLNERAEKHTDMQMHTEVNKMMDAIKDNLVNIKRDGTSAYYDKAKDTVVLPAQKDFPSYADYVQESMRLVAQATAIPQRLNRRTSDVAASIEAQKEALVVELTSAHKMLELDMPAKLRPETMTLMPAIIANLKENPKMAEEVLHDVNRTVGMIKKAELGEEIKLIEKPSEARQQKWASQFPLDAEKIPEKFDHILMLKDDENKWSLVAKPEGERNFAIRPTAADVSMFFDMIKNDHDEAKTEQFKVQFAQKYYNEVAKDPSREINIFGSNASKEALDLVTKSNVFRSKDSKIYMLATIGEDRQEPIELTQTQWNLMFLADDKRDYKQHLAAKLYADVINKKLAEQKQTVEKQEQIENSPEQKEKEKQEETAKEQATKAETKAVANVALSPLLKQFLDLKKKHPDALLLFRTGDFYETYKQDAERAAKILGITLTKSTKNRDDEGKPLAMAGFPYHALDTYLPKLIRNGCRVAICDQIEDPRQMARQSESQQTEQTQEQEQKVSKEQSQSRGFHR